MFDNYKKIEAYLSGEMSEEEKKFFEREMSTDEELRAVVESKDVYYLIADELINQDVSNIIIKYQQVNNSRSKLLRIMFIAIALLVISSFIYYNLTRPSKGKRIFAEVYSPPMGNTIRGEKADITTTKKDCFLAHEKLDMGDTDEAIVLFKKGMKDSDLLCREKSFYYLGLISVFNNEFKSAESYLNKVLLAEESGYEEKAMKLLEIIK